MLTIEDWVPNKKSDLPLYRQIVAYIKTKIQNGSWPILSKLPPQRILADCWQVNRSTIRTALEELISIGLLESRVGSGVWVANAAWITAAKSAKVDWNAYVDTGLYLPNMPLIQEINRRELDPRIVRLGTGELAPDLIPVRQLNEVIRKLPNKIQSFGYEEPKGLYALREQISLQAKRRGIVAPPSNILIVSGALQALQLIFFGLMPKDAHILLEQPSYLRSLKLFQSLEMTFCEVPLDRDGMQIAPIVRQHPHPGASLLYTIPTFNNPTGVSMSLPRRKDVLRLCGEARIPVLEDDTYADLWLDQPPPPPLKALDADGNVLHIGSLSKMVSSGLRIGWMIGPEPVIEKLADLKMQNDYGSSTLSQWAAAEWFAGGYHEAHLLALRNHLRRRRDLAIAVLEENFQDLATWDIPQGGFYVWLKLSQPVSMRKLFNAALAANLLINPGNLYHPLSDTNLRLSYAYAALPDLQNGIKKLAEVIRAIQS